MELPAQRSESLFNRGVAPPPKPAPVRLKTRPVAAKTVVPPSSTFQIEVYRGPKKEIKSFDENDHAVTTPQGKK
jgi:hypothetical protein